MPKQAVEQIENWGVNFGRRSPASGGHFSTPDHILAAVAQELANLPQPGAGATYRIAAQVQRRYTVEARPVALGDMPQGARKASR
jgi:hypothetical protein